MSRLTIKAAKDCRFDALALGEVMLRLDPGEGRLRTARSFRAWEGGGEYNVVRGLKKCFGLRSAVATALVDNEVGHLVEDLMMQGGVDLSELKWLPFDGVGRAARVGLNFTERGFGIRAALGISDRGHTAASLMKAGDIDWERLFGREGVRWFHCGGIFAALSESTPGLVKEALLAAKKHGVIVSYDLNYRASLWKSVGGPAKAIEVNRSLAPYVDVMLGNEEDFGTALGFQVEGASEGFSHLDGGSFKKMIGEVVKVFPNIKAVATTLRQAKTATRNDWGAILYYDGAFYQAEERPDLEILDRVGGGDSFASGLIYGFLAGKTPQEAVNYGATHGALAMTTPGDTSMVTLAEVEKAMRSKSARVER